MKSIKKIVILAATVSAMLFGTGCFGDYFYPMNNFTDGWDCEADFSFGWVQNRGERLLRLSSGETLRFTEDISAFVREKIDPSGSVRDVVCIDGTKLYCIFVSASKKEACKQNWTLIRFDYETKESDLLCSLDTLYSSYYKIMQPYAGLENPTFDHGGGCFYFDKKIFFSDSDFGNMKKGEKEDNPKIRTFSYNLQTEEFTEEEAMPDVRENGEWNCTISDDKQQLEIRNRSTDETTVMTAQNFCEKSKHEKQLSDLFSKNILFSGNARTKDFFADVRFINGHLMVICRVYDRHGGPYTLVFSYDPKTRGVQYCTSCYDDYGSDFYLVSVYEN